MILFWDSYTAAKLLIPFELYTADKAEVVNMYAKHCSTA